MQYQAKDSLKVKYTMKQAVTQVIYKEIPLGTSDQLYFIDFFIQQSSDLTVVGIKNVNSVENLPL